MNKLESTCLSDVGKRRKRNEDAVQIWPSKGVFCVADGMGGAEAGDVASRTVIEQLEAGLEKLGEAGSLPEKESCCCQAIANANQAIKTYAIEEGLSYSGSTVVLLLLDIDSPEKGMVLHAGDSRAYEFYDGQLIAITKDHSAQTYFNIEHAWEVPAKFQGVITRAVGVSSELELEKTEFIPQPGGMYLLCSDGLNNMLSDQEIAHILTENQHAPLTDLAQLLVNAANHAGGTDNVSVVLVRFPGSPRP